MKPKPTSAMHSAIAAGSRSIRAPSASRTSAEPQRPVAERLPCLAIVAPAAAASSAAVVETLKLGAPPPVPAVSTTSGCFSSTRRASSRMVAARPATSSTVSPFARSAIRNAAVCTSVTRPSMISRSTDAASSADRSCPDATRSIAGVTRSLGKEVAEDLHAVGGEDRLGMELNTLGGQLAVAQAHHHAAARRAHLEHVRHVGIDHERVVARDLDLVGQAGEDRLSVVLDHRRLAVDRLVGDDGSAERLAKRLVAEADAQDRRAALSERTDCLDRDPRLVRRARTRRHDDAVRLAFEQPRLVIAHHLDRGAELTQVLDEVVGERVVVVDDEDARAHAQSPCAQASAIARQTAAALASVSSTSYWGSESATSPAPAWTCTRPSFTSAERM